MSLIHEMSDIVYEGYLEKESLYLKSFRKRWIALKNDQKLYSFKSNKISEIIDLSQCENVKVSTTSNLTFELVFEDNKQRRFKATNKNEMNEWIKWIQKVINVQNDNNYDGDEKKNEEVTGVFIFSFQYLFLYML